MATVKDFCLRRPDGCAPGVPLPDNKRLDEWVTKDDMDFTKLKKPEDKKEKKEPAAGKKRRKKKKVEEGEDEEGTAAAAAGSGGGHGGGNVRGLPVAPQLPGPSSVHLSAVPRGFPDDNCVSSSPALLGRVEHECSGAIAPWHFIALHFHCHPRKLTTCVYAPGVLATFLDQAVRL